VRTPIGAFMSDDTRLQPAANHFARGRGFNRCVARLRRIALLDNDTLMRRLAERWLREAGYRVVGGAALRKGAPGPLHLILLDCANPRDAAGRVKQLHAEHPVPVVLLSARLRADQDHSDALAQQLGVRGVLAKPFTRDALLDAVLRALAPG
jgi:CheY-like chemotaxis protein